MKKFALRGLIALAVIVLLCIFFSGTLHTITTAKVRLASAKTGRFEMKITMTGSLHWPETENLAVEGMKSDDTLVVSKVLVSAGSYVREGDIIAECSVQDFDSRMSTIQDTYDTREKEYLELERKNSDLKLSGWQQEWFAAYRRLQDAANALQALQQDLLLEAWKAGISLEEGRLPEGSGTEALQDLQKQLDDAEAEKAAAQAAFDRMKRLEISEDLITYLDKKAELEKEMKTLTEDMLDLRMLQVRAAGIAAPWDGYITSSELKAGDQVTANSVIAAITARDTAPVIRINPGENRKTVTVGTPVVLTAENQSVDAFITGEGIQTSGGMYLDAELDRSELAALGGISAVTEANAVTAVITWKSENSSTLIPSSTVRGSEGNYYIYTAVTATNSLGAEKLTVVKKNITVLGISGNVASVQEDLRNDSIIYMEDRTLAEGSEVMLYSGS